MRYPVISLSQCGDLARRRINGTTPQIEPAWIGDGEDVDIARIERAATEIGELVEAHRDTSDKDAVEGLAAVKLHAALQPAEPDALGVPDIPVLDDPGFWRFIGLVYLWDFAEWRQPDPFKSGKYMQVLDARNSAKTIATRMFLRVASLGGSSHAEAASRVPRGTDLWQSHVLMVRTASAPSIVRQVVNHQIDDRKNRDPLRDFAKQVNGAWTNVLLNLYDDEDAERLISELWVDES